MDPLGQEPILDAAGARAVDRHAIEDLGIPGERLMRAAAAGAERVVRGRFAAARRIVVVAGGGNNGGDGIEVARLLCAHGRTATVCRVAGGPPSGDAALMLEAACAAQVPVVEAPDGRIGHALQDVDLVVDALLGTGARGAPTGPIAAAIEAIRDAGVPVVALDLPSGVDASTGEIAGACVQADVTVAFHRRKLGHCIAPGRHACGATVVVPIGIPADVPEEPVAVAVADGAGLVPGRRSGGTKYDAGAVLVIGGSVGMAGAPGLAAAAALRAGAGVVQCLVPAAIQPTVAGYQRETMVRPLEAERIAAWAERADAVALGPGLGRESEARPVVEAALALPRPLVVDADALWWLADAAGHAALRARTAPTVITPHAGEAARLLGIDASEIAAHRLATARALTDATGAVALLKGADTIVLDPAGRLGIRALVSADLATAGSGDVLTGVIAAHLARGLDGWTAAIAAAASHVAAARAAAAARHGGAIIAGDLIAHLPVGD